MTVMAVSDITQDLIKAHEDGRDVNLNEVESQISAKYGLSLLTSLQLFHLITGKFLYPSERLNLED